MCFSEKRLYAHSRENTPSEKWQPLSAHSRGVGDLAARFAAPFHSSEWAYHAGLLHDLGKADSTFQGYLFKSNGLDDKNYDSGRVNHSSAGAAFAEERFGCCAGRVLAYLIAGHHAGLADYYPTETGNAALQMRLEEGVENLSRIRSHVSQVTDGLSVLKSPPSFLVRNLKGYHLWIRMLYSCLVDADFLDTEAFMQPDAPCLRVGFKSIPELKERFDLFMEEKARKVPQTTVNAIRQEILTACRIAATQQPSGLFSLTVPTGGGKTLSGMAFALNHAERYHKRRVIYVIPYTSIIEQTVEILSGIFGAENVIEHHSNLDPSKETQRSRMASENWDAPIIVTTNVQFFESMYAAKSSRCRKLHNIAESVVILDEAQLLPPQLLVPCVDAINQLTRHYGVTVVLSTATQPALPGLDASFEIVPPSLNLYGRLRRTEIFLPQDMKAPVMWPKLVGQLIKHKQVLCIVNTRRACYDLFNLMPSGTVHLSALMCGAHRTRMIRYIKWCLKRGRPLRVISTQLVEAGVDIDFPVVYRAFAGLDSIAQAAGRCNREGVLNDGGGLGEVHVFVPPQPAPSGLLRKGEDTMRELLESGVDPYNPESYRRYFGLFYGKVNDTGVRFNEWLVKDACPDLAFQFRTAAANFKLIDEQAQRAVIVRYRESETWIGRLRFAGPTREIMRHFQRFTVNLPAHMVARMKLDGLVEEVCDGVFVQTLSTMYTPMGLDVFRESLPVEDLIIDNPNPSWRAES